LFSLLTDPCFVIKRFEKIDRILSMFQNCRIQFQEFNTLAEEEFNQKERETRPLLEKELQQFEEAVESISASIKNNENSPEINSRFFSDNSHRKFGEIQRKIDDVLESGKKVVLELKEISWERFGCLGMVDLMQRFRKLRERVQDFHERGLAFLPLLARDRMKIAMDMA